MYLVLTITYSSFSEVGYLAEIYNHVAPVVVHLLQIQKLLFACNVPFSIIQIDNFKFVNRVLI